MLILKPPVPKSLIKPGFIIITIMQMTCEASEGAMVVGFAHTDFNNYIKI